MGGFGVAPFGEVGRSTQGTQLVSVDPPCGCAVKGDGSPCRQLLTVVQGGRDHWGISAVVRTSDLFGRRDMGGPTGPLGRRVV